ncbi:hypothetical protein COW83_03415 [Candidatus Collierbacteria bacterium CG22_combo_CG10-13_8_21_14_all_43_12]|uniref:Uncharacterized protein n=2 Tax=Candidatus Collieribacteriota TaxID=1752725 RepID=A0A2H0DUR7_9BACT|nr:MAG: hypothetical protein COW83_03415 [Candidatus Collierbacteria bacterium CG22_combo_CG10-13_8_21_14_all_43_12]PJB48285.1 MAG: hypothetical protein CO104_01610 [Candidatus Collierbacteria bacterium CG_4_9_14_3_um_filter_43_16]
MAEFFTSFLSGSWLAAFASWIWNTIFAGGTAWSWSLYVSTWGHAGLLWWLWAFFVLILALILIAYIWIAGVLLYSFWLLAAFAWIIIWVIYLFAMLVIWFSRILWMFSVWIWPYFLLFLKAFMLPVLSSFFLVELRNSNNRKIRPLFYLLCPTFLVGLFFVFPAGWATWYVIITIIYLWIFTHELTEVRVVSETL